MSDFNQQVIEEFRSNEGVVGGYFEGQTVLLLHTTGAKSGLARINPVVTFKDGDRYVIVASKGGAESHPDWYYNLVANPDVSVEVGTESFDATASVTEEPERSELYSKMETTNPAFTEYKEKTKGIRVIPVITLSRA